MGADRINMSRVGESVARAVQLALEQALPSIVEELDDPDREVRLHHNCVNKLRQAMIDAVHKHGLSTPISGQSPSLHIPYLEHLEAYAPELASRIRGGGCDYVDLARSEMFCKRLPRELAGRILEKHSDALLVPHTRLLPYNAGCVNAAYWKVPVESISGDWRKVCRLGDLWNCVSPPDGTDAARFSLVSALLTMRLCASMPRPLSLDDTFYFHHPDNNSTATGPCISKSGPAFVVAKHLAEIWNDMVWELHGQPAPGTPNGTLCAAASFDTEEVCAMLAALSLILHCHPQRAEETAACFRPNHEATDPRLTHVLYTAAAPQLARPKPAAAQKPAKPVESAMKINPGGPRVQWGARCDQHIKFVCTRCQNNKPRASKCPWNRK